MKKFLVNGVLFVTILAATTLLQAQESVPDDLQLRLGGYLLADQDTDIKLSKRGVGTTINIQDIFEMEAASQVFRLDGYYRFTPAHAIEFAWYSINNSSSTDQSFTWEDQNITAVGSLSTHFNTDIYKVNYLYSFYHNKEVELALSAGLYIMAIDVGFSGNYTSNGTADNQGEAAKVTAPLPVAGLRLNYHIMPEWSVRFAVDYFLITVDGIKGALSDSLLAIDYRITPHFGLGVGLNSTRMRIESKLDNDVLLNVNHDVAGGLVYGTINF